MGWKELVALRADRGVHLDENGRAWKWENQAMSDVIKPEDVTNDIFEGMNSLLSDQYILKHQIAAILNTAIDAGLVSPPVWVCRTQWGELNTAAAFVSRENAEKYKNEADRIEHWKGQTK